jgi:hypothetical protein
MKTKYKACDIISAYQNVDPVNKRLFTVVTSEELFQQHAPSFNFELSEVELLDEALEREYLFDLGNGQYLVNPHY